MHQVKNFIFYNKYYYRNKVFYYEQKNEKNFDFVAKFISEVKMNFNVTDLRPQAASFCTKNKF